MRFKDITESSQKCPHCGGPLVEYSGLMEKKDACYYKVKASAKVWPSAYASGRLVQCRKKGAANYGNKSESVAEAQLDEKCWDGYQQQGMKNKGGRQVPNCVPTESVEETMATFSARASTRNSGSGEFRGVSIPSDMKHPEWREPTWSFQEIAQKLGIPVSTLNLIAFNRIGGFPEALPGLSARHGSKKYYKQSEVKRWVNANNVREKLKQGVAEGLNEFALPGGGDGGDDGFSDDTLKRLAAQWYNGDEDPRVEQTLMAAGWEIGQDEGYDDTPGVFVVQAGDVNGRSYMSWSAEELEGLAESLGNIKMNEKYNPEYDDEAGMADNNLETLARAVEGIDDLIQTGDNLPEWCQEKIAVAKSMLVAVWDYMYSEEASDEVDPEIDAMFEAMEQLVHETAHAQQVSVDLVWESFEALDDHMLYETAAWRRKEGKSKKGGLNAKGVASYRRENPGSKLQMAVTTKPSKLKPGSKAAKRRKSFCARMSGVKGPMKKPNGKPTRKALALRKWNC